MDAVSAAALAAQVLSGLFGKKSESSQYSATVHPVGANIAQTPLAKAGLLGAPMEIASPMSSSGMTSSGPDTLSQIGSYASLINTAYGAGKDAGLFGKSTPASGSYLDPGVLDEIKNIPGVSTSPLSVSTNVFKPSLLSPRTHAYSMIPALSALGR